MKMIRKTLLLVTGSACLVLAGCASAPNLASEHSGFLPDYQLLKPVANPPANTKIYKYTNPSVVHGSYHAVIVSPVHLYQTVTKNGVTEAQVNMARERIQHGIMLVVGRKRHIVTKPGVGVAKLQVAITGAELQGEGMKPRNFIPISAALKLVSMATGYNEKKPVLMVELKFTDSRSGKLLREVVTTISGGEFRDKADIGEEFTQLAQTWVKQALKYSEHR